MAASVVYSNQFINLFSSTTLTFTPTGAAVDDVIYFTAHLPGSGTITKPSAWTTFYTQSGFVGFYGGETRVWVYKMQASDFTGGTPNLITITTTAYQSYAATVHVVRGLSGVPTTYTLTGPSTMSTSPLTVGSQTASTSAPKMLTFSGYISGGPIGAVTFDAAVTAVQGSKANEKAIRSAFMDANTSAANTTNTGNSRIDYLILAADLVLASSGTQYAAAGTAAASSAVSASTALKAVASGAAAAVTALTAAATSLLPSSGTVACTTAVSGSAGVPLDASGTVAATSAATGSTTALLAGSGSVGGTSAVSASSGLRAVAQGVAAAVSAVTGSSIGRLVASGIVAAVSTVRGATVVTQVAVDTPPARTLTVAADNRSLSVLPETRVLQVVTETRTLGVGQ